MKTVIFMGQEFQVFKDIKYMSVDTDGDVFAHLNKPSLSNNKQYWVGDSVDLVGTILHTPICKEYE